MFTDASTGEEHLTVVAAEGGTKQLKTVGCFFLFKRLYFKCLLSCVCKIPTLSILKHFLQKVQYIECEIKEAQRPAAIKKT